MIPADHCVIFSKNSLAERQISQTKLFCNSLSIDLRNKKALFDHFIEHYSEKPDKDINTAWREFVDLNRGIDLKEIIDKENLNPAKDTRFMSNAFRDVELRSTGTAFANILPPMSMFDEQNSHAKTKERVFNRLTQYFEKYRGA